MQNLLFRMHEQMIFFLKFITTTFLSIILFLPSYLSATDVGFLVLNSKAPERDQPIAFSHKLHVSQNGVACQYCHLYARRSYSSGVPPVSTCVGCHGSNQMKLDQPNSPEVNKMRDYWEQGEPIPWAKVHDIPDYVRFPHKRHINAKSSRFIESAGSGCDLEKNPRSVECRLMQFKMGGDARCESCDGNVSQMEVVKGVDKSFGGMGWCMQCHLQVKGAVERKRTGSTLSGWFNAKQLDQIREKKMHMVNDKGFHNPNMNDCYTCHY